MKKTLVVKDYYLFLLFRTYFLLHSIHNLLQYLRKNNIFTQVGTHKLGVKFTNFLPTPLGLGINYTDLIDKLIQLAIERFEKEQEIKTSL